MGMARSALMSCEFFSGQNPHAHDGAVRRPLPCWARTNSMLMLMLLVMLMLMLMCRVYACRVYFSVRADLSFFVEDRTLSTSDASELTQ